MILPITPFPSFNQIFSTGSDSRTPWNVFDRQIAYFPRGGVALAAVLKLLQKELKRKKIVVYIPDYFCNQSLFWLRMETCNIKFYPIDLNFKPDWERVENMAEGDVPPDLFVLVHYFGFCNDVELAADFCSRHGSKLLEDAAHALRPTGQIGKYGGLTLFSPHKLLPLPPLGILMFNEQEYIEKLEFTSRAFYRTSDIFWLAKRIIQLFLTNLRINYKLWSSLPDFDCNGQGDVSKFSVKENEKVSIIAINWFYGLLGKLDNIALLRQGNYKIFEKDLWRFLNVSPAFTCKDNDTVPYLFVLRSDETMTREIFFKLREQMIPVQTWPDLPPEVQSNAKLHCKAIELRRTILTLPVHQGLTENQVLYMKNVLNELLMSMNSANNVLFNSNIELKAGKSSYSPFSNSHRPSSEKENKHETELFEEESQNKLPCLKEIDKNQWDELFSLCNRTNLMQNWEYGEAKKSALLWKPKRFALQDERGKYFGIMQMLTVSLPLIGGVAKINRGPLLFENIWGNEYPLETIEKSIQAICWAVKKFRWRLMRINPEFPENQNVEELLRNYGFIHKASAAWGSALVSLERPQDEIRASFHSKWRNLLKKSEKSGLEFKLGNTKRDLNILLKNYRLLKRQKGFSGIPDKLFRRMSIQKGLGWNLSVLYACKDGKKVGGLLFAGHGDTCTYLVGWAPSESRALQASYFLIWQAILLFKSLGYRWLDVGGLNEQTLKGIAHFKHGLKGEMYKLVGEWILY